MNINLRQVSTNLRISITVIGPFRLIVILIGEVELQSFGFVEDEFQRALEFVDSIEFQDQLDTDQLEELSRIDELSQQ